MGVEMEVEVEACTSKTSGPIQPPEAAMGTNFRASFAPDVS